MPKKKIIKKTALAPTVLIAGGAGFIGSNLVETFLLKEARTIVLDNFKTGKQNYVNQFLQNPRFALFDVDINTGIPDEIESVDYVIHLASLEEYIINKKDLNLDSLLTNALGTKNLLDFAYHSQAKFLFVSSTDVYQGILSSDELNYYFGKTHQDERKYSMTEAKRFGEALVWEYYKKNAIDARIARLPEVYGPKMDLDSTGVLGSLLKDLIRGSDLNVAGDGLDKQYYLYSTDAVSGLVKALLAKDTKGKIYSLVNNEAYSALELAYLLKSVADRELKVLFKEQSDILHHEPYPPDLQTLQDLDWEIKIPLKEGILKTLEWLNYKTNFNTFKPAKLIADKQKEKLEKEKVAPGAKKVEPVQSIIPVNSIDQEIPTTKPKNLASIIEEWTDPGQPERPSNPVKKSTIPTSPSNNRIANVVSQLRSQLKVKTLLLTGITLILAFLLVFVAAPGLKTYLYAKSGVEELAKIPTLLTQLDITTAMQASNKAYGSFYNSQKSFSALRWLFGFIRKDSQFNAIAKLMSSTTFFSKSVYYTSKATLPVNNIWESIKPGSSTTFDEALFSNSKIALTDAINNISLAQAELKNVSAEDLPSSLRQDLQTYREILDVLDYSLNFLATLYSDLPGILGVTAPKRYLILFQNSNEIRPTGGFIGSYALLVLDKGRIKDLVIDDIYNPDGQIDLREISTIPPEPIARFLQETRLHLRNANWNPNFPSSAQEISNLYTKVTGEKIDGVIALDLYFVKNLMEVTGPIYLTTYNEEIRADNIYERAQFYSEFNYQAGSIQKRSFLTNLGAKLLETLLGLSKDKIPNLATSIEKSLTERHIMIFLPNSPLSAVLQENKWDGYLVNTDKDYLSVINANLGGTKANYFVKNEMQYQVASITRDGLLRANLALKYIHTGTDSAWPDGPYTNYVRVLTQKGSKLTGARIIKADGTEEDIFTKIVVAKINNYTTFETSFVLNPKETIQIVLSYDLPDNLSITENNKNYALYWQKQAGTQDDKIKFTFNGPLGLTIEHSNPQMKIDAGSVLHEEALNRDQEFVIQLK